MADALTLSTTFTAPNLRALEQGFAQAEKRAQASGARIGASLSGGLSGALSGALSFAGGGAILGGVTKLASLASDQIERGLSFNKMQQRSRVAFESIIGDADKAQRHLADLAKFADARGLQMEGVLKGSQRLQGFGYELGEVMTVMRDLGDLAASSGSTTNFDNIANAIGQIRSASALSLEELNQLRDNGVAGMQLLSSATGRTSGELRKLIENGKLSGKVAADLLLEASRRKYGGLAERLGAGTLEGQQQRFNNALDRRAGDVTSPFAERMTTAYGRGADFLSSPHAQGFTQGLAGSAEKMLGFSEQGITALAQGNFAALGTQAAESFSNAIDAAKAKTLEAGKALGFGVETGVRDSLDQHSPSQVMLELGRDAGQSFLDGFESSFANNTGTKGLASAGKWTAEQIKNARKIVEIGQRIGASAKQIRAAMATGIVESRLRSLNYGDRDSLGIMQQRPSIKHRDGRRYWGSAAQVRDPDYAIARFYREAGSVSQGGTAGQLAQRVQRSGFPRRYDEEMSKADDLISRITENKPLPVRVVGDTGDKDRMPGVSDFDAGLFKHVKKGLRRGETIEDVILSGRLPAFRRGYEESLGMPHGGSTNRAFPRRSPEGFLPIPLENQRLVGNAPPSLAGYADELPMLLPQVQSINAAFAMQEQMLLIGLPPAWKATGDAAGGAWEQMSGKGIFSKEEMEANMKALQATASTTFADMRAQSVNLLADGFASIKDRGLAGFGDLALGFTDMLNRMAAEALAKNVGALIFGQEGKGGGLLGKLIGWGVSLLGSAVGGSIGGGAGASVGAAASRARGFSFAEGGYVSGAGTSKSDSIPAYLSNGEYVMNAQAVARMGKNNMDAMNTGRGGASSPVNQTNHFHFRANENGNFSPQSARQAARQAAGQLQSGMKGR